MIIICMYYLIEYSKCFFVSKYDTEEFSGQLETANCFQLLELRAGNAS